MSTVIKVENLSKHYFLSHREKESFPTLRDAITGAASNFGKRLLHPFKASSNQPLEGLDSTEEFWALRDVSFDVKQGDRIGIIGRNGAGKSTLLKVLSRITEPTKGRVSLKGRVASLLEVGTGFHPELTGRENIFLNGAVLGMRRDEIKKKFDEIVDFAEIEKFLDTPVKRYSSGMYVRLAFAVAAHMDPEILLVDEVLAVGDAKFQEKCLGKMEAVGNEGRTVMFVSHNMATISSLCTNSLLLDSGQLVKMGQTADVILEYYSQGSSSPAHFDNIQSDIHVGDKYVRLMAGSVVNAGGEVSSEIEIVQSLKIIMRYQVLTSEDCTCSPNFHLYSSDGHCVFVTSPQEMTRHSATGIFEAVCHIPGNFLNEGTYFVGLALTTYPGIKVRFFDQHALSFHVRDSMVNVPTRGGTDYAGPMPGAVRPLLNWEIRSIE